MIRPLALLLWLLTIPAWSAPPQASTEDIISAQYPKGTVFTIQTQGLVAANGSCLMWPGSSYKNGKLHAPNFLQNAVLAAAKCVTRPLQVGSQVYLTRLVVKLKNGKVDFVLEQCDTDDCGKDNLSRTQVTLEFPKGILETSGLPVVQEAIGHVLTEVSAPPGAASASAPESAPVLPVTPVSAHGEPLYTYVSTHAAGDRLQLFQDDAFDLAEAGKAYTGSYAVTNLTLRLHFAELQRDVELAMKGNQLIVDNDIWEMAAPGSSPAGAADGSVPSADPPSIDRIEHAVNEFLSGLKQKGAIPQEAVAVPSTAPVTFARPAQDTKGAVAEATGVFELKNTAYVCGSADTGPRASKKKPAYVLSARVTENQTGQWVLTGVQMMVPECIPSPQWHVEIALR